MANILDYVSWRGDLSFKVSPFGPVDALILCQLSYLDFSGLLGEDFKEELYLSTLADRFRSAPDFDKRGNTGAVINKNTVDLLFAVAKSARYSGTLVSGYSCVSDDAKEEQFCALTFTLGRRLHFAAFRGTDDTILGWKEDFNLAIMDEVPAQRDAARYLESAMRSLRGEFIAGGHSKGGNLAVYAAAMCEKRLSKRIATVYNMDGPGFPKEKLSSPRFGGVISRVKSYYPRLSIVGMIFNSTGNFTVVDSDERGIMQHDPFSWQLSGPSFKEMDGFDEESVYFRETFNTWLMQLEKPQREAFIETLFSVIKASDAKTVSELSRNFLGSSAKMAGAYLKLKGEDREVMEKTVLLLFEIARKNASPSAGHSKTQSRQG